jgi:hypothetical protein
VLCVGSALLLVEDKSTSVVNGALVGVLLGQSASPSVVWLFPLLIDIPWFRTEEKSCCYIHHTFLLGFPTGRSFTQHQAYFLVPLPGRKKKTSARGVFARTSFTLLFILLYFIYLYLHRFIKNQKKLVPTIVVILVGLLLSCFIMLSINGWFL